MTKRETTRKLSEMENNERKVFFAFARNRLETSENKKSHKKAFVPGANYSSNRAEVI